MKVMILAGGNATRLYPTTLLMPKQLIPINGKPVISYVLSHCRDNGIRRALVCIADTPIHSQLRNALGKEHCGVEIEYSSTPQDFGTSGRLLATRRYVGDRGFVLYYGDILTNFNLRGMIRSHAQAARTHNCICTIAICASKKLEMGVARTERVGGRITQFLEHPEIDRVSDFMTNVGVAVCSPRVFNYCAPKDDFFGKTLPRMLSRHEFVNGYLVDWFLDVGTFSSLKEASSILKKRNPTAST